MLNLRIAIIDSFLEYLEEKRGVLTAEEQARQCQDARNGSLAIKIVPQGNGKFTLDNLSILDLHDLKRMAHFAQEFSHESKMAYFLESYLDQILTVDDHFKYKRSKIEEGK